MTRSHPAVQLRETYECALLYGITATGRVDLNVVRAAFIFLTAGMSDNADESAGWYAARDRITWKSNDERHRPVENQKITSSVCLCCTFLRHNGQETAVSSFVRSLKRPFERQPSEEKKKQNNKPKQQELRATSETVGGNADKLVWQVGMEVLGVDLTSGISLLVLCQVEQNGSGDVSWAERLAQFEGKVWFSLWSSFFCGCTPVQLHCPSVIILTLYSVLLVCWYKLLGKKHGGFSKRHRTS